MLALNQLNVDIRDYKESVDLIIKQFNYSGIDQDNNDAKFVSCF